MPTSADIAKLESKLTKAKSTSVDGLKVDQHSLREITETIKFCQDQEAVDNVATKRPFIYQFFKPPGA